LLALVEVGLLAGGRVSVGFELADILTTSAIEGEYRVETGVNVHDQ
jgi:hypothetical protein